MTATTTSIAAGTTVGPDLTTVSDLEVHTTDLDDEPTSYRLTFTFDEDINPGASCGDAADFRLYERDATQIVGALVLDCGGGDVDDNQVRVRFNVAVDEDPANGRFGGVVQDAVRDADGDPNPIGGKRRQQ